VYGALFRDFNHDIIPGCPGWRQLLTHHARPQTLRKLLNRRPLVPPAHRKGVVTSLKLCRLSTGVPSIFRNRLSSRTLDRNCASSWSFAAGSSKVEKLLMRGTTTVCCAARERPFRPIRICLSHRQPEERHLQRTRRRGYGETQKRLRGHWKGFGQRHSASPRSTNPASIARLTVRQQWQLDHQF